MHEHFLTNVFKHYISITEKLLVVITKIFKNTNKTKERKKIMMHNKISEAFVGERMTKKISDTSIEPAYQKHSQIDKNNYRT